MAGQNKERNKKMQRILYVEDDLSLIDGLQYTLEISGYTVDNAKTKKEALILFKKNTYDLLLLDVTLPDGTGFDVCKEVRNSSTVPIIFLTASDQEISIVRGLDMGADDYITKPFGMMEFISRVKAVLRRSKKQMKDTLLSCGNLSIDVERHQVLDGERQVELTYKEFEMLRYLMENQGIVLTRDKLLEHIWGYDFDGETRTVDVHIRTLRQKLEESGALIETIRGVGYRIGDRK